MKRWQRFDYDHDIVFTTGYNVSGTIHYADRDFLRALYEPSYARQILGGPIDTGLSPDDTLECLLRHETVEKIILDSDPSSGCWYDSFHVDEKLVLPGAHDYAVAAERELVRQKGGKLYRYERGLAKIMNYCLNKPLTKVPHDYACAALLDDPEPSTRRALKELRSLGVPDALKLSKASVEYGGIDRADCCATCFHWQAARDTDLSTCNIVDGLVVYGRTCQRFQRSGEAAPRGPSNAADSSNWTRVPLKIAGGTPAAAIEINGVITLDFVVDSGAAHVSVPSDIVSTLIRTNTLKKSDFTGKRIYVLADGSTSPSETFVIRSLKVGGHVIENVAGSVAPVMAQPLLGQSFLRRFRSWSIDNFKHELLLEV
jgi:predicted aspartyl protease